MVTWNTTRLRRQLRRRVPGKTVVLDGTGAQITAAVITAVTNNSVTVQATVEIAKGTTVPDGYCFAPTSNKNAAGDSGNAVLVKAPETTNVDTSALSSDNKVSMEFKNAKPCCTYYVMGATEVGGTYTEVATYTDRSGQFTDGKGKITVYFADGDAPSQSYFKAGVKSVND